MPNAVKTKNEVWFGTQKYSRGTDGYFRVSKVIGKEGSAQKRLTAKSKNPDEFIQKLIALNLQCNQGLSLLSKDMTMAAWADLWFETYKKSTITELTQSKYKVIINNHIKPALGSTKLQDITPMQVQKFINQFAGTSKSNTDKIKNTLRQMLRKARGLHMIADDPTEDIIMPATTEGTHRPLEPQEREVFMAVAKTHVSGLWVSMLLMCGPRPEETVPLEWKSDINFERAELTISKAVTWKNNKPVVKSTKSKAGNRILPIPPNLLEQLKAAKKASRSKYVFAMPSTGGMYSQGNMRRRWLSFKRQCDIMLGATVKRNKVADSKLSGVSPYCLRHTYATTLFENGVDLKTIQYLMGHADIETTTNIYTHFLQKSKDLAKEKINKIDWSGNDRGTKKRYKLCRSLL